MQQQNSLNHRIKRLLLFAKEFLTMLTVEPIAFMNFLSFQLFHLAEFDGLFEVICYQTFPESLTYDHDTGANHHGSGGGGGHGGGHGRGQHNDRGHGGGGGGGGGNWSNAATPMTTTGGRVDCHRLASQPSNDTAKILVIQNMSQLKMYLSLVHILPALVAHVFMGALGDKHGRKINILIGIIGMLINTVPYLVLFEYKFMPLWVLIVVGFISGSTGYMGIVMISSFAYLADVTVNTENLTVRMVIYSNIMHLSGAIGSVFAVLLISHMRYSHIALFTISMLTLSFFYSLFRLHQIPPPIMKRLMTEKEARRLARIDPEGCKQKFDVVDRKAPLNPVKKLLEQSDEIKHLTTTGKIKYFLTDTWLLLKAVWLTYTKPRAGRQRRYLLLMASLFCLHLISNMAMHVTNMYVYSISISWNVQDLANWKLANHWLHFFGNLLGVIILKKLLKCRETTIILIALFSHISQEVLVGVAQSGWFLYLAICMGSLGPIFMPAVKSYVAQLVDSDEVGKAFVMFGLAHDIGNALSSVLSNAIFNATVAYFPGFLHILCSGFLSIGFFVVLFIHVDTIRRENAKKAAENDADKKPPELEMKTDTL